MTKPANKQQSAQFLDFTCKFYIILTSHKPQRFFIFLSLQSKHVYNRPRTYFFLNSGNNILGSNSITQRKGKACLVLPTLPYPTYIHSQTVHCVELIRLGYLSNN